MNYYILTLTEVFVNQNRVNVREYTVKMMPNDNFEVRITRERNKKKMSEGVGGKSEREFSEVNTRAVMWRIE
jgi:hypothetical protein